MIKIKTIGERKSNCKKKKFSNKVICQQILGGKKNNALYKKKIIW